MSAKPMIIVVGNEKGGTGKSTVAMHVAVSLLGGGSRVGTIDLDARQATLTRYVENRLKRSETLGRPLPQTVHEAVPPTDDEDADKARFLAGLERLSGECDVIVIDTPGSAHPLSQLGHSYADKLITPLNDSFVDLDVLAKVDPETMRIARPSHYSEMVWESKKIRALRGEKASFEWFVMRNRLSNLDARNKREMGRLVVELAKRIGFHPIAGLSERVIYRELFLEGLTLLDLQEAGQALNLSHVAARQELRNLVDALGLRDLAGEGGASTAPSGSLS